MSNHHESHFRASNVLRDIVIGMADGLTVPFALAAGLSGAALHNSTIMTAGLAEIVAGSIAMGLGGYLAGKTEVEHYHGELKREHHEVEYFPDIERKEIEEIFQEYGISPATQKTFVDELSQNKEKWVNFMMRFELGLEKPDAKEAKLSALRIGGAYAVGGILPLAPYAFLEDSHQALLYSALLTILALGIFGYYKSKITSNAPWAGAVRVILIGVVAAFSAYMVARWIS